ncbi:hypothetical protein EC991_008875 [Linnemannia zychae]|nr:hypothetical protein EC991_008875 [Linnemannia zychae]
MLSNKRNSSLSIAGAITAYLSISSLCAADRVFLTNNANNTDIYPGCPIDIGFRVQYSDLAQLKWVQLQVLGADNSLMIEGLDNSTRAQWDDTRTKSVTWTVPNNWPPGDYIVRAFGNASYSCQHAHSPLKDAPSGNSGDSYSKSKLDLLSKNLSAEKLNPPSTAANEETTSNSDSNDGPAQKTIGQLAAQQIQDQTILNVLDELRDYNLQKLTLTLTSGETIPMSERMDNSTIARFAQTLELSNSALRAQSGKSLGSTELVAALHKNSSLIVAPPVNPTSTTTTLARPLATTVMPINHTDANPSGREFVQQDRNQIQDKSNDASLGTGMTTTRGLFAGALAAVIAAMIF